MNPLKEHAAFADSNSQARTPKVMKTQTRNVRILLTAAALAAATNSQAQIPFGLDLRSSNNASGSGIAEKLYNDSSLGAVSDNRLPGGTSFWVVFDGNNDGVPFFNAPLGTTFDIDSLLGPDDVLLNPTTLHRIGMISRNWVGISADLRMSSDPTEAGYVNTKPIYGLLFNESNVDSDRPGSPGFDPAFDGAKFGVISFGSRPIPEFGNAVAVIQNPLYADQFNFQPVPEPATTALFAGALLGVGAVIRRVRQNRR